MTTGAQEVAFTTKRLLGLEDFRDRIYGRVLSDLREMFVLTYSLDGVYTTPIAITADGADKFQLTPFSKTTDGAGHVLQGDVELAQAIQFENTNTVPYDIAFHYAQRPRLIQINPRTGQPEIAYFEDTIGERGTPDAVVVSGPGLKLTVDTLCEVGVSHAGRKAVVWKKFPGPAAITDVIAFEVLTIAFDGLNNTVTSADTFGQGVSPSLVAADYEVVVLGPTVRRNTNLELASNYAFIGRVTGAGAGNPPTVFSIAGQRALGSAIGALNDVTRVDAHGDTKISVTADAFDIDENQIEVKDFGGAVKFSVDEDGDVVVGGNLTVLGTEVVTLTETIVANQIIGGNLNVGDADTDIHTVRGTWLHKAPGATDLWRIDGATGRATFGDAATTVQRFRFRFNVATVEDTPFANNDACKIVIDNPNTTNGVNAGIETKLSGLTGGDNFGLFIHRVSASVVTGALTLSKTATGSSPSILIWKDVADLANPINRYRFGEGLTLVHTQPTARFQFLGGFVAGLLNHAAWIDVGDNPAFPATDIGFILSGSPTAGVQSTNANRRWGMGMGAAGGDLWWFNDQITDAAWVAGSRTIRIYQRNTGAGVDSRADPGVEFFSGRDFTNPTTDAHVNTASGNKCIAMRCSITNAGAPVVDTTANNHFNVGALTDLAVGATQVAFDVNLSLPYSAHVTAIDPSADACYAQFSFKLTSSLTVRTFKHDGNARDVDFDVMVVGKSAGVPTFP